jgi:hypothetical protein
MIEGIQGGLWASIVILLLLGSLNVVTSVFRSVLGFIVYGKYPHFDIIDELVLLLSLDYWNAAHWQNPANRREIAEELEYLAHRFERSLPRSLRSRDHLANNWICGQTALISAKVRKAKRKVLLEGPLFRDELRAAIGETLIRAASGEWQSLIPTEKEVEKLQGSVKVRTLALVRNLMVALLPLGIVLGLQFGPFTDLVSKDLAAKLTPFAFIWLALGVLSWLDPRSEERISGTKEVMNIGGFLGRVS